MAARTRLPRKRPDRYHHGDLRQALIQAALRTIQRQGVQALTLRSVGDDLGVSRTALYRHFADKSALLAAVATEGFRTFRLALVQAWEAGGRGRTGFEAMGAAYVQFAVANPSHYRVMFGGFVNGAADNPDLAREGAAAFHVLVEAIVELQQEGIVRTDDPQLLARYIWAVVHGIAMLALDGLLGADRTAIEQLTRLALERMRTGIGLPEAPAQARRADRLDPN